MGIRNTTIGRKCKSCGYYSNGWCYWLGKHRKGNQTECDDGYSEYNPYDDIV